MGLLYKVFKDCFTGKDNESYDFIRFLIVLGFIAFIGFEVHEVWVTRVFNEEEYARALMWIYSGGSGGVLLKHWTEPDPKSTNKEDETSDNSDTKTS